MSNLKEASRFMLGAALMSPVLAAEDVLRYFGVPISEHGLTKNDEGKGMFQIWKECGKPEETKVVEKQSFREDYRVSIRADIERMKK